MDWIVIAIAVVAMIMNVFVLWLNRKTKRMLDDAQDQKIKRMIDDAQKG